MSDVIASCNFPTISLFLITKNKLFAPLNFRLPITGTYIFINDSNDCSFSLTISIAIS